MDAQHIGHIEIHEDHSLVDLPVGMPKDIFQHLRKVWVCGQRMSISRFDDGAPQKKERSKPKERSRPRDDSTPTRGAKEDRPPKKKRADKKPAGKKKVEKKKARKKAGKDVGKRRKPSAK